MISTLACRRALVRRHGFSLTEVLLAIFILGIGVVAVAALFPAGIAQQRQSADDIIGPIVANNALSVLRTKLKPVDFGTYEQMMPFPWGNWAPTIEGDWPWGRPAYFHADTQLPGGEFVTAGSISIFHRISGMTSNVEIPGNPIHSKPIIINQEERYYPMQSPQLGASQGAPQYVWDCMFRRFQGKVLVAIFVYRATVPGGNLVKYAVPRSPAFSNPPPMPYRLVFAGNNAWDVDGNLSTANVVEPIVAGTDPGDALDLSDPDFAWQAPAQWVLDQNNNVHRLLSGRRAMSDGPVELVRAVPEVPPLPTYYVDPTFGNSTQNVVTHIWYVPLEVKMPLGGGQELSVSLKPVYVTVREL